MPSMHAWNTRRESTACCNEMNGLDEFVQAWPWGTKRCLVGACRSRALQRAKCVTGTREALLMVATDTNRNVECSSHFLTDETS